MSKGESDVYSSLGLVYLKLGHVLHSISLLHSALAINSTDAIASELLNKALEINLKLRNSTFIDESITSLESEKTIKHQKKRSSTFNIPKGKQFEGTKFIKGSSGSDISFAAESLNSGDDDDDDDDSNNGDDVMELDTD